MTLKELTVTILEKEYWYGSVVDDGVKYPFSQLDTYEMDIDPTQTSNQAAPLLLSTKGRYIWSKSGFKAVVANGEIRLTSTKDPIQLYKKGSTLKEAFLAASERFFPSSGKMPPALFFKSPQYNTWIEFIYNQNQTGVLNYASQIIKNGYPAGVLMIDDGWSDYYGKWDFNREKFPNPKEMVRELHQMGFKVMLWTCPFITPDSVEFKELRDADLLVKDSTGNSAIREWWNGYSAVLDMSHPGAVAWYDKQNQQLMRRYAIDGFKFDAGDPRFYTDEDETYGNVTANEQCRLWAEYGLKYAYNEYRACFKEGGQPLVQRLADKNHSWDNKGMKALVANQLTMGLLGYPYSCPDMIGGGEYLNFLENSQTLDETLFVRYAQTASLMPMMQFSAAPWRILSQENASRCLEAAKLHNEFSDLIEELAHHSSLTGEPITRYLEYEFPNQHLEKIIDQFMLGTNIMVAPVIEKNAVGRKVVFPKGEWKNVNDSDKIVTGPATIYFDCSLDQLLMFECVER